MCAAAIFSLFFGLRLGTKHLASVPRLPPPQTPLASGGGQATPKLGSLVGPRFFDLGSWGPGGSQGLPSGFRGLPGPSRKNQGPTTNQTKKPMSQKESTEQSSTRVRGFGGLQRPGDQIIVFCSVCSSLVCFVSPKGTARICHVKERERERERAGGQAG